MYSGMSQHAREQSFDDNAVAGYFVLATASVDESVIGADLNGNGTMDIASPVHVMLARPNTIGGNPEVVTYQIRTY